jgi:hypothetical protein
MIVQKHVQQRKPENVGGPANTHKSGLILGTEKVPSPKLF